MFIGCNLLKNVEIAGNVEKICKSTFSENCSNLEKVIIGGNVGTIETYAFYKCGNLLSIEINGDVGNIGESAFSQCNLLKNVEIDGDVGDIGSYAFSTLWSGCSGLENVKIGGSVNSFGDSIIFKNGTGPLLIPLFPVIYEPELLSNETSTALPPLYFE